MLVSNIKWQQANIKRREINIQKMACKAFKEVVLEKYKNKYMQVAKP